MAPDQLPIDDIYFSALEKPVGEERSAYLDEVCGVESELRDRVERLLSAQAKVAGFLESPASGLETCVTFDRAPLEQPGARIGPYKLLQEVGRGGMGVVYRAEQHEPVRREVALKIIKPGMDTRQVIARFEAERQALSLMDHPHIARVLDAGTTDSRRPYFVMELVRGQSITQYCDERHFTPRQRLELLLPVFQAIQHAHQKGIIHRDIKPSNVLVAEYDRKPVPKVIDFGVAKATCQSLTEKSMFTGLGQIVGTLEYMSPEQAKVNQLDIDTRSDIYSLGVLMYELLTGSTPLDKNRLRMEAWEEMLRLIREEEPPKPSSRLTDSKELLPSISAQRQMEPAKLAKLVRGELDWIVMKALEKDRSRRYATASAFAADVQSYLNDEPVKACPPSAIYRFRKLARRNRRTLATAVLLCGMLLAAVGAVGGTAGWVARDRAARRAETYRVVTASLEEADRLQKEGRWLESLDAARRAESLAVSGESSATFRRQVAGRRADLDMIVKLEQIRLETSAVKQGYFDNAGADSLYSRAFRVYGIDVERLSSDEAAQLIRQRSVSEALAVALDHWAFASRAARGAEASAWLHLLAVARQSDPNADGDGMREALGRLDRAGLTEFAASDLARDLPPPSLELLGVVLQSMGAVAEAVTLLQQSQRQHPGDFWINHELARSLMLSRPPDPDSALRFYSAALALRPRNPGAFVNLASAHFARGDFQESAAACRRAIRLQPHYAAAHYNLGMSLAKTGATGEAIEAFREAVRLQSDFPEAHYDLGVFLGRTGSTDEAIEAYRAAIRVQPNHARAHCNLGRLLQNQTRFAEALVMLRRGHELGSLDPLWQYPSAQWVKECQELVELAASLPAVLEGRQKAVGGERLKYAEFCLRQGNAMLDAARLYAAAFQDQSDLADDLTSGNRYNAACAAALAGGGQRDDEECLTESDRALWRKQAIDWLQADLALWAQRLEECQPKDRAEVRTQLLHWQSDPDLAGVRDPASLAALPVSEQEECQRLWAELAGLLTTIPHAPAPVEATEKPM